MQNSDKLVSVIIPAYDAEKTIENCLDCVLSQTYKNIEIIVIDDGSADETSAIVKSFMNNDSRVKLLTQNNCGVGAARNAGIEYASGEYITFCDADDFPTKQWIEVLCKCMNDETDISICTYQRCSSIEEIVEDPEIAEAKILNSDSLWGLFKRLLLNANWNKLYRKDRIIDEEICFGNAKSGEDLEFNLDYLSNMNGKIGFSESPVYVYMDNPDSVTHKYIPNKWNETIYRMKRLKDVLVEYGVFFESIKKEYYSFYLTRIETCLANCMMEEVCITKKIRNINYIIQSKECRTILNFFSNSDLDCLGRLMKKYRPIRMFGLIYTIRVYLNKI